MSLTYLYAIFHYFCIPIPITHQSSPFPSLSLSLSLSKKLRTLALADLSVPLKMISEDQSSPSSSSSSLKDKLFKSPICLSGCFSTGSTVHHEILDSEDKIIRTPRSTYSWLKSTAHELPEIRDRCRNLIFRIGRGRRHLNSGDFSYDPSSYALNFEDDSRDYELPLRDFSSRLPASPPRQFSPECVAGPASVRREIVGFS